MLAERVIEWTEQWKQQGLEEGRREGPQEGEAALLLRLLEQRFGALDEDRLRRLRAADPETLLRWGERLFTAKSLDELLEL